MIGVASLDSFGDPAYGGLRDPVRGYVGIESHLNLWGHFLWARLRQVSDMGAASCWD
jgi:hypothetical protein